VQTLVAGARSVQKCVAIGCLDLERFVIEPLDLLPTILL